MVFRDPVPDLELIDVDIKVGNRVQDHQGKWHYYIRLPELHTSAILIECPPLIRCLEELMQLGRTWFSQGQTYLHQTRHPEC